MNKELNGTWNVTDVVERCISPLKMLGDQKVITDSEGYNIMNGKKWGYFTIRRNWPNLDAYIIDYDDKRNGPILQHVTDRIYKDGDEWTGQLLYRGKAIFDFRLRRVDSLDVPTERIAKNG